MLPCHSPDRSFLSRSRRASRRIAYSFPIAAAQLIGVLIPFTLPPRLSPDRIFRLPCTTRRWIAYSFPFPFAAALLAGLLLPIPLPPRRSWDRLFLFPFPPCGSPHRIFRFPCPTCRRITFSFSLPAAPVAGLLIPFHLLPRRAADCLFLSFCRCAARRIADSGRFANAPRAGLLAPFPLPPRRSPDCLFLTLSHRRAHWITYFVSLAQHTAGLLIPIHFPPCNSVTARASRASGSRNETRTGLGPREGQRAASEQCAASATKTGTRTETKTARSENDTRILL